MIAPEQLPFEARQRWRALQESEIEAQAAVSLTVRRISELSNALDLSSSADAANIEHELTRLRAKLSEQQKRHQHKSSLCASVRHWFGIISANVIIEDGLPPRVKMKPGETQSQAITRLRLEIIELQNERRKIQSASPSRPEAKAMAAAHVAAMAERGKPRLLIEHDKFETHFSADRWEEAKRDPASVLAWVAPELVLSALERQIDDMPITGISLTQEAKAERLRSIGASLGVLERAEEALIVELELGEGPIIPRRIDADPKVMLGITVKKPTAKAKAIA